MPAELHIRIHPEAEDPGGILDKFPFEPGQKVVLQSMELVIVDLGSANDTNYVQDWFLNSHDGVLSFFILSDEEESDEDEP